ncbi:hypothetical protein AGMMS49995_10350 [Endomicrobiia bacterium]|nr:hypothetical protein AGMMS49995_10350 [Endomicrobiia bacterium]
MEEVLKFSLYRKDYGKDYTRGSLFVNDSMALFCSTIERAQGSGMLIDAKVYNMILTQSNRFGRMLPLLLKVPNHEGIRIHAGNTYVDTTGCILVGDLVNAGVIEHSRVTERKIVDLMKNAKSCIIDIIP